MASRRIPSRDISTARVPQLVCANRRSNPDRQRGPMKLEAEGRGAWLAAGRAAQSAEQRANGQGPAQLWAGPR